MTLDSVKDVVAILSALVGLTSAVATGIAKVWSCYKGSKATPPAEPAAHAETPAPALGVILPDADSPPKPPLVACVSSVVQAIPAVPLVPLEQARAVVRAPAIALLALAATGLLFNVIFACYGFVDNFVTPLSSSSLLAMSPPEQRARANAQGATSDQQNVVLTIVLLCSMAAASVAALFGGLSMLKLQNHLVAVAGSIAIMPGTCLCFALGFPVGAWSILVLTRPEVRAAFHS